MTLSELTAPAGRLALVGLAKNTGKTVAMTTILRELAAAGRCVGVTSIGRDGEASDVLDERIEKPRIELREGSLVATTDMLLSASGVPHERVERTGLRTPLGEIAIARLEADGAIEVAGPGTARDVREVADAMAALGAERVLIDGALDRRAAASPAIADGVVVSTGAALHRDPAEVARRTRAAIELLRLPLADDRPAYPIEPRLALDGSDAEVAEVVRAHERIELPGALWEGFAAQALRAMGPPPARPTTLVVENGTRVFLRERDAAWYRRQGLAIEVRTPIALHAITVNPLAPRSHRFDPHVLPRLVAEAVPGVPVLDVMSPDYAQPPLIR